MVEKEWLKIIESELPTGENFKLSLISIETNFF